MRTCGHAAGRSGTRANPSPILPPARIARLGLLLALFALVFGCTTGRQGPDIGRLPTITSADPQAEAELQRAQAAQTQGRYGDAEQLYRNFIGQRGDDPLAAVAQLELGKLLLAREAYQEARGLFQTLAEHRQPAMSEQGRFYMAVAMAHMGEQEEAARILRSMVGRTVAPEDTGLLLLTLADAEMDLDNAEGAVVAINRLLESDNALPQDQKAASERLHILLERQATPEQVNLMLDAIPPGSPTYEPILRRAVGDAQVAGDVSRIRELIGYFEAAGIPLDDDLRALSLQASAPSDANPQAVGAILSLSGRTRQVAEYALRGLMLAADLPPSGPMQVDAPKLVFRDDGGRADRAIQAVDELVNIHRVIAIIGPMDPVAARAAAQRAAELSVPLIALSPASGIVDAGDTVYQAFPSALAEVETLVAFARDQGRRRLAVLYPHNAYGLALRDHVHTAVAEFGGLEIVGEENYQDGDTAFGRQIAALARTGFDAILVPDSSSRLALIAPALAAAGLWSTLPGEAAPNEGRSIQLLAPSVGFSAALVAKSGRYLQGAAFTTPYAPNDIDANSLEFADRYRAQFATEPDAIAAVAHDAYVLVSTATSNGALDRQTLSSQLENQKAQDAVSLRSGLGHNRGPSMPIRVLQLVGDNMEEATLGSMQQFGIDADSERQRYYP